ncbi:hypothetical protein COV19_05520 [Candidatus Woesearchaeota archaeon CG10_big_fil_rev_8_21_14_0_10_44_13]|nr:MAG: hypothetical protein COV19_05520 [Candidatus Woesearchaeota archaeon CG10_big_fil_rev_8_21_14_0_10_44_13]
MKNNKDKKRKKKILFIENKYEISGGQMVLINLLRNIDRSIFEPYVVTQRKGELYNVLREMGVKVMFLRLDFLPVQYNRCPYVSPWGVYKLMKLIKKYDIDIVHSNNLYSNKYGAIAAKIAGIPSVWTIHNEYKKNPILRMLYRITNRVIFVSKRVGVIFQDPENNKGRVIYNGADTKKFFKRLPKREDYLRFGIKKGSFVVGMIARIHPFKGYECLCKSIAIVSKKYPEVVVLALGKTVEGSRYDMSIKGLIKKLGIEKNFIFGGFEKDVSKIIPLFSILVLPSVKGEGFPLVILEAQAMGKPVVSSRIAGVPEMIEEGKNGLMVKPGDYRDIAKKIIILIEDPDLRKKIGEAGRKTVNRDFTLKKTVRETEKLYIEVLNEWKSKKRD